MGLKREDLVKMALFLGCDYTQGVKGIASVNAIEIISAFPDLQVDNEKVISVGVG